MSRSSTASDVRETPSAKKVKNPRDRFPLDLAIEEDLLEWIQEHRLLWDKKSMDYKKTEAKNALWFAKAALMEKTPEYLKGWWKGIRDTFTRLHKNKSGSAATKLTDRETWLKQHCAFYSGNVTHRGHSVKAVSIFVVIIHKLL